MKYNVYTYDFNADEQFTTELEYDSFWKAKDKADELKEQFYEVCVNDNEGEVILNYVNKERV